MTDYLDLLTTAQEDPSSADFHALRMAYTRSDRYRPYTQQKGLIAALDSALRSSDLDTALNVAQQLLTVNYLDIEAHMAAAYVYTMQENVEMAAHHQLFANGLIKAILSSGTGRAPEAAFIVIDIPEEYTIMRILGLELASQKLLDYQGQSIDMMEVHQRGAGNDATAFKMYFNIDLPRAWLSRRMDAHNAATPHDPAQEDKLEDQREDGSS